MVGVKVNANNSIFDETATLVDYNLVQVVRAISSRDDQESMNAANVVLPMSWLRFRTNRKFCADRDFSLGESSRDTYKIFSDVNKTLPPENKTKTKKVPEDV